MKMFAHLKNFFGHRSELTEEEPTLPAKAIGEIYTLECGLQVQFQQENPFQNYRLETIKRCEKHMGCGNEWSHMTPDEYAKFQSLSPAKQRFACDIKSLLINKLMTKSEMKQHLEDLINADCWGIFSTNANRTEAPTVYYDARLDATHIVAEKTHSEKCVRTELLNDLDKLVEIVESGKTLVIVLGSKTFMECYYMKIGDQYLVSEVDHAKTLPAISG